MAKRETMKPVTREAPCPVCGGDCGLILCGRSEIVIEGFSLLNASLASCANPAESSARSAAG